jgi:arylsulfatase A-like enzyme
VEHLERQKLWDRTILAIIGDHGEGLGEHGMYAHSQALYEEQTAVPLVFRVPGMAPRREAAPVTLTVLPSLILEGLGGRWPTFGKDQAAVSGLRDVAIQEHGISGYVAWRSLRRGTLSYHHRYVEGWRELYDLAKDPGELDDLAEREPRLLAEFAELEQRVITWEARLAEAINEYPSSESGGRARLSHAKQTKPFSLK